MKNSLQIKGLSVSVEGKTVVEGVNLTINPGEVHALMGPNGSGKSSLALSLMGHPGYKIITGQATIAGADLLVLEPNERVKKGLFLTFQNPVAVPGVTLGQLTWSAYQNIAGKKAIDLRDFYTEVKRKAKDLGLKEEILDRFVNDGFSGGEKKKAEILMLLSLTPKFVIFDEIDSGLDIDSLKSITTAISRLIKDNTGILLITHNQRILKQIKADFVHVLKAGRIIKSGNHQLAVQIEEKGYAKV